MVKWVNAQNFGSPIASAITGVGQTLWGDTLTPAVKRAQLEKLQRENAGADNLGALFRDLGSAAAKRATGGAPGGPIFTGTANPEGLPQSIIGAVDKVDPSGSPMALGIKSTADALGMPAKDLGTILSYETGGTFDPTMGGPTTQYGRHRGLIQFGEPQAAQYGADFSSPEAAMASQLGPDGAVAKYFNDNGWKPGMGLMDAYSIVNAGGPGRYGASDAGNGGAPGTVADKVNYQMGGHADNADRLLSDYLAPATASPLTEAPATDGTYNPMNSGQMYGELYARAIEAGLDPQKAADAARGAMAGMFGAENQATTDAFVGAGGDYARTYSGFAADQNRQTSAGLNSNNVTMRGQDLNYDASLANNALDNTTTRRGQDLGFGEAVFKDDNAIVTVLRNGVPIQVRKREMLPTDQAVVSDAERKGITAGSMDLTDPQKLAYIGAEPKNAPVAETYVDGKGVAYRSLDGQTDAATGQPLPPDALKTSVAGANRTDAGLNKTNARDAEAGVIAGTKFTGLLGRARQAATEAGPEGFGVIGQARSLAQDTMAAVNAAAPLFGKEIEQTVTDTEGSLKELAANGDPVAKQFFGTYDPSINKLELYARLLPYQAATALAEQSGRGLSDADVKRFQAMIGNPTGLFGSQQTFLTIIDTLQAEVNAEIEANKGVLKDGVNAGAVTGTLPPTTTGPMQIQSDADYEALPSGADFIAPDGSHRRKP